MLHRPHLHTKVMYPHPPKTQRCSHYECQAHHGNLCLALAAIDDRPLSQASRRPVQYAADLAQLRVAQAYWPMRVEPRVK